MKKKGFILISVLFMVIVLIILMTSLIAIISQTLYRVTLDMKRDSLIVMSDSALVEALIILTNDPLWGNNNEKLFMKSGEPDMKIAGFNPLALPMANSEFDFENNTAYYITFDPNDPALGTNKCFSVNNLNNATPAQSWRPGIEVPPYTADVVITVMEDGVVRHVESFIMAVPDDSWMQNGSRGTTSITANGFTLGSKYGEAANLHSNYDLNSLDETSIGLYGLSEGLHMDYGSTLSATDKIMINSLEPNDPNTFKPGESLKEIPEIPISSLVSGITFEPTPLPSGIYEAIDSNTLKFTSDVTGEEKFFHDSDTIVPEVYFHVSNTWGPTILISTNIEVEYDIDHINGTGNVIFLDTAIGLADGINVYAPGEVIPDPNTGKYNSGNLIISNSRENSAVLVGQGNIYSMGSIQIEGSSGSGIVTGLDKGKGISLYSQGDIELCGKNDCIYRGLIYTCGDFKANIEQGFLVDGALIAAGKDPDSDIEGYDPGCIDIKASNFYIRFDDRVLSSFKKYSFWGGAGVPGSGGNFRVISWYEF